MVSRWCPRCLEQVPRERADSVRAEAAVLERRGEEDVDAGVAVLRVVLLPVLDATRDLALDLDHERRRVVELGVRSPPARDLGLAEDLEQPRLVRRRDRPEATRAPWRTSATSPILNRNRTRSSDPRA